jgi:hypothetical protein
MALSACFALAEAWLGIAIAYYTDRPVSFCIALLSALGYFVTRGNWLRLPAASANAAAGDERSQASLS